MPEYFQMYGQLICKRFISFKSIGCKKIFTLYGLLKLVILGNIKKKSSQILSSAQYGWGF